MLLKKCARVAAVLPLAFFHLVRGYWTIKTSFHHLDLNTQQARVQQWAMQLLRIANIALEVTGQPPADGPVLLVANHISWLDIVVLHAARHCRFVSKDDIKQWPLVGTLSDGSGTLYIKRESSRDAHRMVQTMAKRLREGDILAVFPEGTTGDGITLRHFHANLLQAAIDAQTPVQAVALRFMDAATGAPTHAPRYADQDTLAGSIWRTLSAPRIRVVVDYGAPQFAEGRNRREWAAALRSEIASKLAS